MNSKPLLLTLGLGALTVALIALPGSSAQKSAPSNPTPLPCPQTMVVQDPGEETAEAQEVQELLNKVELAGFTSLDDDEDVRVFVTSGNGWLGVGITEVTAEKVKELKLPAERGVLLGKIVPESPAAKAGLKEGDVVIEINGQRVEGTEQFRRMIREIPAGRSGQFTVWRDGHAQSLAVTLGKSEPHHAGSFVAPAAPGAFAFQMPEMPPMDQMFNAPWFPSGPRLGIDAENLDGDFGNFFGAPDGEGILVRGVFPDSPAAKAGLKVGDVITSADGEKIRSIGELREKLAEKKAEKSIKLGLIRNKAALSLSVELPAPAEKKGHHNTERTQI